MIPWQCSRLLWDKDRVLQKIECNYSEAVLSVPDCSRISFTSDCTEVQTVCYASEATEQSTSLGSFLKSLTHLSADCL